MKASWMSRTLLLAVVIGLFVGATSSAQEPQAPASEADLKAELAEVKAELKAVRSDLQRILKELAAIKAASKQPAKRNPRKPDTTVYKIDIGDAPFRGPKDAAVTIVEYVDFHCPFCTREAPVIKKVLDAYPNDVRWVFKHFPLAMHKNAKPVHAASALAYKQKGNDGFWKMHDLIVAAPKATSTEQLRAHAESLGMDLAEFDTVMGDPTKIDALIKADMTAAPKYGVRGTPSVFINGLRLSPRGFDNYKARIDDILKQKKG